MTPLLQLVFILAVGTICQIAGWRLKVPSILLLLVAGIISGPIFGVLHPDALLGDVLMPFVELAVAVILFEGGLSLTKTELGKVGSVVLRLITVSALITWVLLGILAYTILSLSGPASAVLGAILVVSGPTVVIPLLRLIRARAPVEPVLRWEGILIDPIGVILTVLVAEVCEAGVDFSAPGHVALGILIALTVGCGLGWIGALILRLTIGRNRVPDQFIVPLTLTVLFSLVFLSNLLHEQSGLLTSTIMGLIVARNQKTWVHTVEDFIGHTQMMFIAVLFIILAARLDPSYFDHFDLNLCLFILAAIVIVRPIAVFISTIGTSLSFGEKFAISALAPRGIVSAALASLVGASLAKANIPGMEAIAPYTFATIIGTVAIYGIFSPWIFKLCRVQQLANEGVMFAGGGPIATSIAKVLTELGFRTLTVDSQSFNIRRTKALGLEAYQGNILSDGIQEEVNLEGLGKLLAFTPNDEANSLATVEFRHIFGSNNVFQLSSARSGGSKAAGRVFATKDLTLEKLEDLWFQGYRPFSRKIDKNDPPPTNPEEYILAEIENSRLYILADDDLTRASKPDKQIVFGRPASGATDSNV